MSSCSSSDSSSNISSDYEEIEQTYKMMDECNNRCRHGNFKCKVITECCNNVFPCRKCHDEKTDHDVINDDINKVICKVCGKTQLIKNYCELCGTQFATYYCDICKIFSNHEIYHCDKCNRCYLKYLFTHCDKCNHCLPKGHTCKENIIDDNCPICLDKLDGEKLIMLECGHIIHKKCYRELIKQKINKCPLCSKVINEMIMVIEI